MPVELRATYRVQLNSAFTLGDAAAIAGYLARLGISHLYCSPYLQSAPGSTHGYDVVNPHQVNEELGGAEAHTGLVQALERNGLGQVLDIVPNHMAILATANPWWWDVLQNGPSSPYAEYFDVEWNPPEARHENMVLVPVLGDQYGRVLEAGEIRLEYDPQEPYGPFTVHYFDIIFPVDPSSLSSLLASAAEQSGSQRLAFLAESFDRLPRSTASDRASARLRSRDIRVLSGLLANLYQTDPAVDSAIRQVVQDLNTDPDALDVFLSLQNYRLAFWRVASRELGYRRFFDINSLIGVRMEDEQVFQDIHSLVLRWVEEGSLDGLRVDHPDGLRDPEGYLIRLRNAAPQAWIVIEKILEPDERIPASWPVAGTVGYDFLNRVNGLWVDPRGEAPLTRFYAEFTGRSNDYAALVLENKRIVCSEILGSDLNRLTSLFLQVCERHRRFRDYSQEELRNALCETAACLPVYRTYIRAPEGEVHESDVEYVSQAITAAKDNQPDLDPELFDFFRDLLLLKVRGDLESELVMRFQQFTGPVMAKGVEDTLFYNYYRLVSLNEVGGSPGLFGITVDEFHQASSEAQKEWPRSMLATTTHDTKRSADVRARLDVLSEIPEEWEQAVRRWSIMNEKYRRGDAPDRNDEYLLYQTLAGAWPLNLERAQHYMEKAIREAKVHTSWTSPNAVYEDSVTAFVEGAYGDEPFIQDLIRFTMRLLVEPGRVNSLSQTLIKLTSPGIPDLYQGSELWDLTLVDPDNRQPVDYDLRRRLLDLLHDSTPPEQVLEHHEDGLPKLWVIRQSLAFRRRHPELFGAQAGYHPLIVRGPHAIAYSRSAGPDQAARAITVAPRLVARLREEWEDTVVILPPGSWRNLFTHETVSGGEIPLSHLLARFPVALLVNNG